MQESQRSQKYLPPIPEGVEAYFFMRMCADGFSDDHSEWYDFRKLDNLPPCCLKYEIDPSRPLAFRYPPQPSNFTIIDLPLRAALETMSDDQQYFFKPGTVG